MQKKIKRIYCDTSIIGGIIDSEFSEHTIRFLGYVKTGLFSMVISPVVDAEILVEETPQKVIREYKALLQISEVIDVTEEALSLQQSYIEVGILTPKWEDDALHVALASTSQCDVIASWNFKHIVNFQKIPLYNAVNTLHGYNEIRIYSPLELEL